MALTDAHAARELARYGAVRGTGRTQTLSSRGTVERSASMRGQYDYEVVFTEDRLGLTLKCHSPDELDEDETPRTVVKSTSETARHVHEGDILISVNGQSVVNLNFRDVRRLLKVASRPIRLRFRTSAENMLRYRDDSVAVETSEASYSTEDGVDSNELSSFVLPLSSDSDEEQDDDDMDSHHAVVSESFGDADSTRTTENSSILTDITDSDLKLQRHSRFSFLRKPFRRGEGVQLRSMEMHAAVIPDMPRVELALESPVKAALRVYWKEHPAAVASQVQYSRDRTMRVWKTWSGRIRRSQDNDREMLTMIYGLDFGKSYVVRIRYEFARPQFSSGEWSTPSAPVVTLDPGRIEMLRSAYSRARMY
ncbi:hypothetical protein Poli38472_003234 [Pythium oligandrum]|uniref:PDZ domain-containing protein n=1 Tax=Pythium oligandrum TaxID=41045 RepID=A0A8K1C658_PYTOL|nr:hypothetical protein Poli38472_003234 [Pythium oligandrum]|eukprot:TMW57309.1 hypothetical protein Poli38472_003234 [Pythium oligandrum]